ncbi:MAG: hypothetical protein HQK83_05960 [Fibrobacteria bacterium]|nr:hypothetical protein [Fibrobacteria bacterium]
MNPEITPTLIMIMISCVAIIGAINSRGTAKTVLSYLLAFICLAITTFCITQHVMALSQNRNSMLAHEAEKIMESKLEKIEEAQMARQDALERNNSSKENSAYKETTLDLVTKVKRLNYNISVFNLEMSSDEEYEEQRNKASYYLGGIRQHKSKLKSMDIPDEMKSAHETVIRAVDVSLYAASQLRRYFNAEDSAEEAETEKIFKSKARQAAGLLDKALQTLQ